MSRDDDHSLWEQVTRAITPLKRRKRSSDRTPAASPKATSAKPKPAVMTAPPAMSPPPRPKPQPALAPLERRVRQKLARGTRPIDGRIDLHGMTQAEAHAR